MTQTAPVRACGAHTHADTRHARGHMCQHAAGLGKEMVAGTYGGAFCGHNITQQVQWPQAHLAQERPDVPRRLPGSPQRPQLLSIS